MSDKRHQRDRGSREDRERSQNFYERIYGVWQFYKQDLATGKTETIKVGKAGLEINTAIFRQGIIGNVRQSPTRAAYFSGLGKKDVDWFCPVEELKKGSRIFTPRFVYWATFTAPAKAAFRAAA